MAKLEWKTEDPRQTNDLYAVKFALSGKLVLDTGVNIDWSQVETYLKLPPLPATTADSKK